MSLDQAILAKDAVIQELYINFEKQKIIILDKIAALHSDLNNEDTLLQAGIEGVMQIYLAEVEKEVEYIEGNDEDHIPPGIEVKAENKKQ